MTPIALIRVSMAAALVLHSGGALALTNVATQGIASQSTTTRNSPASKAIDGTTDGNFFGGYYDGFYSGSVTHTDLELRPWWSVALDQDYTLSSITVWNRTDERAERLSNFTISVWDDGVRKRSWTFAGLTPRPSITVDARQLVGDTVRVQLNEQNYLSLAEVQVYALPPSIPEPPAWALMGCGVLFLGVGRRRASSRPTSVRTPKARPRGR